MTGQSNRLHSSGGGKRKCCVIAFTATVLMVFIVANRPDIAADATLPSSGELPTAGEAGDDDHPLESVLETRARLSAMAPVEPSRVTPIFLNVSLQLRRTITARRIPNFFMTARSDGDPKAVRLLEQAVNRMKRVSPLRFTAPPPDAPPPRRVREYDVAFLASDQLCLSNAWHGISEFVLPLAATKALFALATRGIDLKDFEARSAADPAFLTEALAEEIADQLMADMRSGRHVLLVRSPLRSIWGTHNMGCPTMNHFPYGITTNNQGGWMALALFADVREELSNGSIRLTRGADAPTHVEFFGEMQPTRKFDSGVSEADDLIRVHRAVVAGFTSACRFDESVHPPSDKYPYYTAPPMCSWFYDVLRKYIIRVLHLQDSDAPVTLDELRCPRIGVVSRQASYNGRAMEGFDQLVAALREHVRNGGPLIHGDRIFRANCGSVRVLRFEGGMGYAQQVREAQQLTVMLGPRGMGHINSFFMRRGAGLVTYSGRNYEQPLSIEKDNFPWHPLRAALPSMPSVLAECGVLQPDLEALDKNHPDHAMIHFNAKRCLTRTLNFCNLTCAAPEFLGAFNRVVAMMWKRLHAERPQPYHAEGLATDDYIFVPPATPGGSR